MLLLVLVIVIIIIVVVVPCRLHPTADRIRMHKNRLRINDLSASDNGVFDCRAQNLAGTVNSSNSYLLSVPGIPTCINCQCKGTVLCVPVTRRPPLRIVLRPSVYPSVCPVWLYFSSVRLLSNTQL